MGATALGLVHEHRRNPQDSADRTWGQPGRSGHMCVQLCVRVPTHFPPCSHGADSGGRVVREEGMEAECAPGRTEPRERNRSCGSDQT